MTTILNGTEFVAAPATGRRIVSVTTQPAVVRTGMAVRRSTRRNRRAARVL